MRCRWLLALTILVPAGSHPRLAKAEDVTIAPGKAAIEFKVGKDVAAKYQIGPTFAKPVLWPVLAPGGTPVTRTWPIEPGVPGDATKDHPHQKSGWFCHGNVIPEGVDLKGKPFVNFWADGTDKDGKPKSGIMTCVKVGEPKQLGKGHAAVTTWNEWKTPDGVKILDEERTIHLRDLPAGRLFVFECKLTAGTYPITFGDDKEGSFGVRVHDAIRLESKTGGVITSSDGTTVKAPAKDDLPVWGRVADWNDYSGTVDGKAVGVTVFADPKNQYPSAWHTRAYGLMTANPFARVKSGFPSQKGRTDVVKLDKGKSLSFRYAIYAHTGDATTGKVAEAFEQFKK